MKRLSKDRKGFTLVEMVLVIAIIVILASVFMLGIGFYLEAAYVAAASVTQHNESVDYVTEEVIGQTPGLQ